MSETDDHVVRMTRLEADEEVLKYSDPYPVVEILDRKTLEDTDYCIMCGNSCPCMRKVAIDVLDNGGEQTRSLRMGDDCHRATARYVEVDGEPRVFFFAQPLDVDGDGKVMGELLYHDALSGVYNRRFYEDRLRHQFIAAGVAIFDLDDFKLVNDTLGHHAGDLAIKAAARAMRSCIRDTDMLVRYGGDEFVLVLPGIGRDDFRNKLRTLARKVAETTIRGYPTLKLAASVGGVLAAGRTIEDSVRSADKLMYRAKQLKEAVVTEADLPNLPEYHKPLVLIVDDSEMNREILREMLKDDYDIFEAASGEDGLEVIRQHGELISLVLLDIMMPGINGFEVLSQMSRDGIIDDIPVIMISSEDKQEAVLNAYELGASDYISRPFDIRVVRHRVSNIMHLYAKQRRLSSLLSQQFYERERESRMLVDIMASSMELRNGESGLHVLHIRNLTEILLERLVQKTDKYELTGARRSTIAMASTLHDIGKMAIPDAILNKPGRLTAEEFEVMKTHAAIGAQMLENLNQYKDDALMQTAKAICHYHHERWDGRGYPEGLKGDQIPIEAQVVSVADVYDALTSERVYKKAIPHEKAMRMIADGECGAFNPLLMECLVDVGDRIRDDIGRELPPPQGCSSLSANKN